MPYLNDWKPTREENPAFKCRCGSDEIWYRKWESSDGAHDDIQYRCRSCGLGWWVEGPDS